MQVQLQPLWCLSTSQDTGVQRRAQGLDLRVTFAGVAQAANVEPVAGRGAADGLPTWCTRRSDGSYGSYGSFKVVPQFVCYVGL